jgi:hypothetical protein
MIDEGPNEIELQLTRQLEKIVTRAVFYRNTGGVQLLLNHEYKSKSIVASIDVKNWNNTHDIFQKELKRKGIKQRHIPLLSDILDDNYHVIISQSLEVDGNGEQQQPIESAAQVALRLASEQCSGLFLDQFGTPYAAIEVGEHVETIALKSSRFRNWLCKIFYNNSRKNSHEP